MTAIALFVCGSLLGACGGGADDTFEGDDDVGDDDTADDDTAPPLAEEVFVQEVQPTDVLFVVDNSCSMAEEQDALDVHFAGFLQHLLDAGVDYHIGITVLDDWPTQPPIGELFGSTPYIDANAPDPVSAFSANMTMGAAGMGSCEVGLEAAFRALTPPLLNGYNAGFYREEARLAVVVVSDEDDGSAVGCSAIQASGFVTWLTTLKPDGIDPIYFAAIIGDQPNGCTSSWGDAFAGDQYHDVVQALGAHGCGHSICEWDWTPAMDEVGEWASAVPTTFSLVEVPVAGTLRAFLDPDGETGPELEVEIFEDPTYQGEYAFVYDAGLNALVFDASTAPPGGAQLRVTFEIAA